MKNQTNAEQLRELYSKFTCCTTLPISTEGATKIVYGQGNPDAHLMIIGEAPGKKEDELGMPFVGRSGQLLTKTLQALGIDRKEIFITNVVKCRPPNNRTPTPQEILLYKNYFLIPEIRIIKPKIILTLGTIAFKTLLPEVTTSLTKTRGQIFEHNGSLTIPTYHPAYVIRAPKMFESFKNDLALGVLLAKKTR